MKNKRFEWSIAFLKIFFMMFAMIYLCSMLVEVIIDGFIRGAGFDINKQPNTTFLLSFSMFWALFNASRYRNINMELDVKGNKASEMLAKTKDILSSMRLKVEKEESDRIVFKSTLTSALLVTRVTAQLEEDKLKLSGASYYVERLAGKL